MVKMTEDRQQVTDMRWKLIISFLGTFFFGLLLWLSLAVPAEALSLKLDVSDLSERAEPIVVGTVEEVTSQWN